RSEPAGLRRDPTELGGAGKALGVAMDVTNESQVNDDVARAVQQIERVDVLVSNAGIQISDQERDAEGDGRRRVHHGGGRRRDGAVLCKLRKQRADRTVAGGQPRLVHGVTPGRPTLQVRGCGLILGSMNDPVSGPASITAICEAILRGREPPAARMFAGLASYRWLVVGTVCIGSFMGQVDSSITQLLLPRLELEFNAELSTVSWVAVAYLLAMAAFLPIFGRLADMLGRKLLYTGGFLLFVLTSALCGLAPNLPVLIAFRVLQGIGAALLSSNSVAIVVATAGTRWRGRALGVQSAAQAVGLSAGPAIGGLVLDTLDWRWVFWINVPVGLAGAVMGWFLLPPTKDLPDDARFDWT